MTEAFARLRAALNPAQRAAVDHGDAPLLVLAGAGSGKTRVLTARIARLVLEEGVRPDEILAVTFTNKAAGEMKDRVSHLLGVAPAGLWIGTFHSVGARLLRRFADRVGRTPNFTIYDPDDLRAVIQRELEQVSAPRDTAPTAIAAMISGAANALVGPEEFAAQARDPVRRAAAAVYARLEPALRRANAAGFDDLLTLPVHLLREHADVRDLLARRFRHLLVDEYQDTNRAQYECIRLLAAHGRVTVVGDDDQSIYGWRGADVRNILDFERDFPQARVVRLEENYRSTPQVLALANAVIAENRGRRGKVLRATRADGDVVRLVTAADERDEAEFVVDEIHLRRHADARLRLRDCAVLYRTNAQSRPFEEALRKRGVPYRLIGAIRFYDRREVKDLVAWLRLVANPADDEAFRRALQAPRRGVGEASVEALAVRAVEAGVPLLAAAARPDLTGDLRPQARSALAELAALVADLRRQAVDAAVDELLRDVVTRTGYDAALRAEGPDGEERLLNVASLIEGATESAADVDGEVGFTPLDLFLQRVSLVASADESDPNADAVVLMTMHNAKGLEFPLVCIAGLEDGLFPLRRAAEDPGQLEEERRLFYVGITRAERTLYLVRALRRWRNGESQPSTASRFIRDLPVGLVERRETVRAGSQPRFAATWDDADDGRAPFGRGSWSGGAVRRGTPVAWAHAAAPAPAAEEESQDAPRYSVGERVKHGKFGTGTIAELSGQGAYAKVKVDFDDEAVGRKTLVLAQARLARDWE
jgi:DNA helicase-2/ATP-dependent DNA helicase PcrA